MHAGSSFVVVHRVLSLSTLECTICFDSLLSLQIHFFFIMWGNWVFVISAPRTSYLIIMLKCLTHSVTRDLSIWSSEECWPMLSWPHSRSSVFLPAWANWVTTSVVVYILTFNKEETGPKGEQLGGQKISSKTGSAISSLKPTSLCRDDRTSDTSQCVLF